MTKKKILKKIIKLRTMWIRRDDGNDLYFGEQIQKLIDQLGCDVNRKEMEKQIEY
jgi:hypothetical protein